MFKLANNTNNNVKTYTQQRAVLKPMKNMAIYEEEELEDDDTGLAEETFMDDSSSCYSGSMAATRSSRNDTMLLAQFLSTTGPEEYEKQNFDTKKQQQFKRASRLLSRLRKRPTMPVLRSAAVTTTNINTNTQTEKKLNYIPLPVYDHKSADGSSSHPMQQKKESAKKMNSTATATTTTPNPTTTTTSTITTSAPSTTISSGSNISNHINRTKRQSQRDSGVYSETNSERDSSVISTSTACTSVPPLPFTTVMSELQFPHPPYAVKSTSSIAKAPQQHQENNPRRPAPLPPAVASAAIATATSVCSSDGSTSAHIRSVPEAALKRRSVRLRHVQVQTNGDGLPMRLPPVPNTPLTSSQACPHCRQSITPTSNHFRRPSCPPALSSGPVLAAVAAASKETDDSKVLLEMIMSLKSQLEEEKQCRLKLEKAIHQRQSDDRNEQLAREKERWAGACLWLNDRIALLPE
ncbi:hypothetical protein BD408DRAFT_408957 [Parasitella parasitica]|nr:hypothetical protein BD408DRAFT_408957 [Parasitella parasitica]